ncbi:putative reverse transcriptase domain-containing protein [Lupinus albus]|uniref:Putative reverse transcriptase domain-containing protein n=1 Tax=Lupinus albus TaxID=3870 RepID=A0A6A4Q0H8_LUPAL|nr:putative reverse transcriptase domain-containing protein [Lupinus albus]
MIQDFRPISLVGSPYKITTKILAGLLKAIFGSLISSSKLVFLGGRNIIDALMVVNKVIHSTKKDNEGCLLFKVDFEKSYGSINWELWDYMLFIFGFSIKWKNWIKVAYLIQQCLF